VTRLSRRVNQVVVPASISMLVAQFRVAALVLLGSSVGGVDRDGPDVRVNYVGGSI
jgi:hypothetical protein